MLEWVDGVPGKASKRKQLDRMLKDEVDQVEKDSSSEGVRARPESKLSEVAHRLKSEEESPLGNPV